MRGPSERLCVDFTINKGAYYITVPPHARPAHAHQFVRNWHIDAQGKLVYTNTAFGGAARGAGPPQSNFAMESAIDMLADKLGIDQLEFRKMNSLMPGGTQATGTVVTQWPFPELCDMIRPHYDRAKREAAAFKSGPIKRGVGIATHGFGIGYPADVGKVSVEVDADDGITIYCAIADPGEGNDSMLAQIAAHMLGLPLEKVRLYTRVDRAHGGDGRGIFQPHDFHGWRRSGQCRRAVAAGHRGSRNKHLCRTAEGGQANAVQRHQEKSRRVTLTRRPARAMRICPMCLTSRWWSWRLTPKPARYGC